MIKSLIFDIGGVLVDFRPAGVLKDMGISEERARVILRESIASPLWHEMDRGAIPEEEVIAAMRGNVPEEMRADYDRFIEEGKPYLTIPFAYSAQWLKQFHERGYGVYILSNYPVSYFEAHKAGFEFLKFNVSQAIAHVNGRFRLGKPNMYLIRFLLFRKVRCRIPYCGILPQFRALKLVFKEAHRITQAHREQLPFCQM